MAPLPAPESSGGARDASLSPIAASSTVLSLPLPASAATAGAAAMLVMVAAENDGNGDGSNVPRLASSASTPPAGGTMWGTLPERWPNPASLLPLEAASTSPGLASTGAASKPALRVLVAIGRAVAATAVAAAASALVAAAPFAADVDAAAAVAGADTAPDNADSAGGGGGGGGGMEAASLRALTTDAPGRPKAASLVVRRYTFSTSNVCAASGQAQLHESASDPEQERWRTLARRGTESGTRRSRNRRNVLLVSGRCKMLATVLTCNVW